MADIAARDCAEGLQRSGVSSWQHAVDVGLSEDSLLEVRVVVEGHL